VQQQSGAQQWEYTHLVGDHVISTNDAVANEMGRDGWEAVGITSYTLTPGGPPELVYFFKRPTGKSPRPPQ
jgi:hypothetical protein